MKTKLTLTVQKKIIESAKKLARERHMSLSQLFEEVFSENQPKLTKTPSQKVGEKLLKLLADSESLQTDRSDKGSIKSYLAKKHA